MAGMALASAVHQRSGNSEPGFQDAFGPAPFVLKGFGDWNVLQYCSTVPDTAVLCCSEKQLKTSTP